MTIGDTAGREGLTLDFKTQAEVEAIHERALGYTPIEGWLNCTCSNCRLLVEFATALAARPLPAATSTTQEGLACSPHHDGKNWRCETHKVAMPAIPTCAIGYRNFLEREFRAALASPPTTPAELAIRNAVLVIEEAGAHPLLTDAVVLLQQARERVADYVDSKREE